MIEATDPTNKLPFMELIGSISIQQGGQYLEEEEWQCLECNHRSPSDITHQEDSQALVGLCEL